MKHAVVLLGPGGEGVSLTSQDSLRAEMFANDWPGE